MSNANPGDNPASPARVIVLGTTSTGKTTSARRIAEIVAAPHIEVDALFWDPGWKQVSKDVLRERVTQALRGDRWVVDGNYHSARDLIWPRAELALWLDYSISRALWQLTKRTGRRIITGEELWNGNTERQKIVDIFRPSQSLYAWALKTHWRHRREWAAAMREPQHAHIRVVRTRSPGETERWLAAFAQAAQPPVRR